MSTSPSKDNRHGFKNKMFRIPLFGESDNTEDKLRSAGTAANTASIPPVVMKVDCNTRGKLDFMNGTMNQLANLSIKAGWQLKDFCGKQMIQQELW